MKRILILSAVLVFTFGSLSFAYAEGDKGNNCGCSFTVSNPDHKQELGGKSGHSSHKGLHKAADKSPVVTHTHGGHSHGGHS